MWLARVFSKNQDVQINNDKNVKFFSKDFIDIALEAGQSIKKSKKYNLILEMTVSDLKGDYLLFSQIHI